MMPYAANIFALSLIAAIAGFCTKGGRVVTVGDRFGAAALWGFSTLFGLVFLVSALGIGVE